ncbi:MAG: hypothetical protein R3A45_03115 [Bdellovibrionota bacterium]
MNKYTFFMHTLLSALVPVTFVHEVHAESTLERVESVLQNGDLIFLNLSCGELCDAIEDITLRQFKTNGPELSHVGMAFYEKSSAMGRL